MKTLAIALTLMPFVAHAQEWRTMQSAPHDGTTIDLLQAYGHRWNTAVVVYSNGNWVYQNHRDAVLICTVDGQDRCLWHKHTGA